MNTESRRHDCEGMRISLDPEIGSLAYISRYREYGVIIPAGGDSILQIRYCPFCGLQLPTSLRLLWFEQLEKLGLEPGDDAIPDELRTERWWRDGKEVLPGASEV